MKLTKKNARRQKAIQKALASGKGLGGLLVGLAAATVAAGCNGEYPSSARRASRRTSTTRCQTYS